MITARAVADQLNLLAPQGLQESWDNSGLITGTPDQEVTGVLVCLDVTPEVVREAVDAGLNMIISHHPPVFNGLKTFTGRNHSERVVVEAIRNDLVLYACHTNLDQVAGGVSDRMADCLGLVDRESLAPRSGDLVKLVCFVPEAYAQPVAEALFRSGAGTIGNYDSCSFRSAGTGTFRGGALTNPFAGNPGEFHREPEIRLETVMPSHLTRQVLKALLEVHPYEEVAYDLYPLKNDHPQLGFGRVGVLPQAMTTGDFLNRLKKCFGTPVIRHSACACERIRKVAVCGGSGSEWIPQAVAAGCDAYVTADLKYHQWFDCPNTLLLADVGHFESEQFGMNCLHDFLVEKIPNFAVRLTRVNTNPVLYS